MAGISLTLPGVGVASGPQPVGTASDANRTTPTLAAPTPISFAPPLSIEQTLNLLQDAANRLPTKDDEEAERVPLASIDRMVTACYNYLDFRDDLHTSLAHYSWVELDSARVTNRPGKVDTDTFVFDPPVRQISALTFETRIDDVYLHRLRVYDEKGELRDKFDFGEGPKLIEHSIPRREVFHLWRRTTVSRLEVEYSSRDIGRPTRPRVVVFGGITSRPEHIKTALYHLTEARQALRERRLEDAREAILTARKAVERTQRDLKRG